MRIDTITSRRMRREARTIEAMLALYCQAHHPAPKGELCPECTALRDYAHERLRRCPFQTSKPTCGNCTVHCYRNEMRDRIKEVMRYAGPRMIRRHPVMALHHLLDGLRRPPLRKKTGTKKQS